MASTENLDTSPIEDAEKDKVLIQENLAKDKGNNSLALDPADDEHDKRNNAPTQSEIKHDDKIVNTQNENEHSDKVVNTLEDKSQNGSNASQSDGIANSEENTIECDDKTGSIVGEGENSFFFQAVQL